MNCVFPYSKNERILTVRDLRPSFMNFARCQVHPKVRMDR